MSLSCITDGAIYSTVDYENKTGTVVARYIFFTLTKLIRLTTVKGYVGDTSGLPHVSL